MALTLEQRRAYALDALNNPVLGDIFVEQERSILARWEHTKADQTAAREQAWNELQALKRVRAGIESALNRADEAIQAENEAESDEL